MSGSSPHIIVTEVPPGFLKRKNIRSHFSQFGTIVRLSIQSSYCVITFETHEQAENAVLNGTEWKGMLMKIDSTPHHDPFGPDEAIINEELNWFAEEPGVFGNSSKSKHGIKSYDAPPKKIGRVDFNEVEVETSFSPDNKAPKKLSNRASAKFLDRINFKSRTSEDARIDDDYRRKSILFSNKSSEEGVTHLESPREKSRLVEDNKSLFRSSDEVRTFSRALGDVKTVFRSSENQKRDKDSLPKATNYARDGGKSTFDAFEKRKKDRESSPTVIDRSRFEGRSVLRTFEDKRRDSSPVGHLRSDGKSILRPSDDKKKREIEDKKRGLPVMDSMKSDGKLLFGGEEEKKKDFSPILKESSRTEVRIEKVPPVVIDSLNSQDKKDQPKFSEENYMFLKVPDGKSSEENKIVFKTSENMFFSKPAVTLQDKLDILEERDKLVRLKSESAGMESVLQGTCPDMCPEKERILREVRNMVDPYEALPDGRMDHAKAVKEYTRSSADQDQPLPHELRPEPVLTMTMTYLINYIISRIDESDEENLHSWYDFSWGRLRAIRKDIRQQALCDKDTVIILEQCARFHIACYDRLWGLKKSVFDIKLNDETLNNCLASLVTLYRDLRCDGIVCPNEAEFNAYYILFNMKSSIFLETEFQKFSQSLKESNLIKEAVKIHLAYHTNMFSTYFKLIKNTSYLNACLAQKHFEKVRSEALKTIIKSHCIPNKQSRISAQFLMNLLNLDSLNDCIGFCQSAGLLFNEDHKCFKIYRSDIYFSEFIFKVTTPSSLVLNKRITMAEAVVGNGLSLPVFLKHTVHESFTDDGIFKESSIDAADQEEKMLRDNVERKLLISHLKSPVVRSKIHESEDLKLSTFNLEEDKLSSEEDSRDEELFLEYDEPFSSDVGTVIEIDETKELVDTDNSEDSMDGSNIFTGDRVHESSPNPDNENMLQLPSFTNISSTDSSAFPSLNFQGTVFTKAADSENPPASPKQSPEFILPTRKEAQMPSHFEPMLSGSNKFPTSEEGLSPKHILSLDKKDEYSHKEKNSLLPVIGPTTSKVSPPALRRSVSHSTPDVQECRTPSDKSFPKSYSQRLSRSISQGTEPKWPKSLSKEISISPGKKSKKNSPHLDKLRKKLSENMKKVSARKYLRLWKEKTFRLKSSKELEAMVLYNLSTEEYLKLWGKPPVKRSLNLSRNLKTRKNSNMMVQIILHTDVLNFIDKNVQKIGRNVINVLGESSIRKADGWGNIAQPNPVFWKLVFALPNPPEGGTTFGLRLRNWCKAAFYAEKNSMVSKAELQMSESGVPVIIKIHVVEGLAELESCSNLSALVAIRARDWESTTETENRIEKLVSLSNQPIPVAVLNIGQNIDYITLINKKVNYFHQCCWENSKTTSEVLHDLASHVHLFNIKVKPFCTLIEICSEKLFDSLLQDSFLHDGLDNSMSDPNNIILIYNQLIDKIEKEIKYCKIRNYFGTAYEFKNDLEKYQNFFMFPDNYKDINFEKSLSLRCLKTKLRSLKMDFKNSKDFISFYKNYCDDISCLNVLKPLLRYIKLPEEETEKIADHLRSVQWIPFVEILVKGILTSHLLSFKVAYREDEIREIFESRFWFESEIINI